MSRASGALLYLQAHGVSRNPREVKTLKETIKVRVAGDVTARLWCLGQIQSSPKQAPVLHGVSG